MPIVVDYDHEPMVRASFAGAITDDCVKGYLAESSLFLADERPYVLVLDAMSLNTLTTYQRRLFAVWIKEHNEALKRLCHGQAYIGVNILHRMILRSVLMVSPMPAAYKVFSNIQEAWRWGVMRLEEANIPIDERTREIPESLQ